MNYRHFLVYWAPILAALLLAPAIGYHHGGPNVALIVLEVAASTTIVVGLFVSIFQCADPHRPLTEWVDKGKKARGSGEVSLSDEP